MTFTVINSLKQIGEKLLKKKQKTTHQAHLSLHKKQTALYRTLHNHCKVSSDITSYLIWKESLLVTSTIIKRNLR